MDLALSASLTQLRPTPWPGKRKKPVTFDSSFLLAVMETPTPWEQDISEKVGAFMPVVLHSVRDELHQLAAKGDKKARFASLALELVEEGRFALRPDGGGAPDDEIVSYALGEGAGVATVDSELSQRLRAARVSTVITLKGGRASL